MATKPAAKTTTEQGARYERDVAQAMEDRGFSIEWPPVNQPHYDFIAAKGNVRCAVQAKDLKGKAELNAIKSLAAFMDTVEGRRFRFGFFVTTKGLTKGAASFIEENPQARLRFYVRQGTRFVQVGGSSEVTQRHIGVFTFKGGVGKSKVALLLAAALAHLGKNVVLVDLNRAQNLYNLVGDEGLYLRNQNGRESVISVFREAEWDLSKNNWKKVGSILDAHYVIFDCPQFFEKPAGRGSFGKMDLVIAPIMLTPDAVGIGHAVLKDTVGEVRQNNPTVPVWFLVNRVTREQAEGPMPRYLQAARTVFSDRDKVMLLPPNRFRIPYLPELEQLGMDRALNPANKLELLLTSDEEGANGWTRNLLRLAEHLIGQAS